MFQFRSSDNREAGWLGSLGMRSSAFVSSSHTLLVEQGYETFNFSQSLFTYHSVLPAVSGTVRYKKVQRYLAVKDFCLFSVTAPAAWCMVRYYVNNFL